MLKYIARRFRGLLTPAKGEVSDLEPATKAELVVSHLIRYGQRNSGIDLAEDHEVHDFKTVAADFMADLFHLADRYEVDPADIFDKACDMWAEEVRITAGLVAV